MVSTKGKSSVDIAKELKKATGQADLDAIIDCGGAEAMIQLGFSLLSISGRYADVGLVGDRIDVPLFPRASREQTFYGSFWGNYTDNIFKFEEINENLQLPRKGEVISRAVMKF